MKRIVFTVLIGAQPWIFGLLAGLDYTFPGAVFAFTYVLALVFAGICWTCPIWKP